MTVSSAAETNLDGCVTELYGSLGYKENESF